MGRVRALFNSFLSYTAHVRVFHSVRDLAVFAGVNVD